jgi:glycosyltransferase involved in cell wall biosynthesis
VSDVRHTTAGAPLRVCYIISSFRPVIGGAERATETLSAELAKQGCDVVVLTRRYKPAYPPFEAIEGVPVYRLGYPARTKWSALTFALHAFWLLATRFRRYRIVHVQNIETPLLLGFLCKIFLGRHLLATIHGESPILGTRKRQFGQLRLRLMARLVDGFTSINLENQRQLLNLNVPGSRIHMIPNGINTDVFHPPTPAEREAARAQLHVDSAAVVTLYMGRLVLFKRVDLLLRAWACLPHDDERSPLLIVGEGPELDRLMKLASELGIAVRFEGPTDQPVRYLHAADIFVLASGHHQTVNYEGLSVALLEAMATGLTVVVSDCPGNRALVQPGENGLVCPMDDVDGLAESLRQALDSPELRQHLGPAAQKSVQDTYSIQTVARQVMALYEQVLAGSHD